jgi:uncharacterized protein (DUF1330 family)
MPAYAVAHMLEVSMGPAIVEYLRRIDGTLEAFGGRFIVHGGDFQVMEGSWPGYLIVIEFPDRAHAHGWYASPAYQEILGLRTGHSRSDIILIDGVDPAHRATDVLGGQS